MERSLPSGRAAEIAIFALAFTVFGLVGLALAWSGDLAYATLARATGHTQVSFLVTRSSGPPIEASQDLDALLVWHREWSAYVTGIRGTPPGSSAGVAFTTDEYAHMADVRSVFRGAEIAGLVAIAVVAVLLYRARQAGRALALVRGGGLAAAGLVALVGVAAAIAFEPLFLLFHEVFFPQGNFLFDPATSNLLRLYPEWYWTGVTAGVAGSFVCIALASAGAAQVGLRRRSDTYTRAA